MSRRRFWFYFLALSALSVIAAGTAFAKPVKPALKKQPAITRPVVKIARPVVKLGTAYQQLRVKKVQMRKE